MAHQRPRVDDRAGLTQSVSRRPLSYKIKIFQHYFHILFLAGMALYSLLVAVLERQPAHFTFFSQEQASAVLAAGMADRR